MHRKALATVLITCSLGLYVYFLYREAGSWAAFFTFAGQIGPALLVCALVAVGLTTGIVLLIEGKR